MANDAPPRWDRRMQQRLARGEAAALGEFYDRYASLVRALAHRVLADDEAADRITREVFGFVWEHPDTYDPKLGSMRSWVATLTQQQAVKQLRTAGSGPSDPADSADSADCSGPGSGARQDGGDELEHKVRRASVAARADYIRHSMPFPLREALELAYYKRRDYRQTATDLGVTEEEARRRLRLGLQLLSSANSPAPHDGPPGYGRTL